MENQRPILHCLQVIYGTNVFHVPNIASQVIAFLSFTVSLLTLLRVTWDSIMTLFSAPSVAKDHLSNLGQEIYELEDGLRTATRRQRP